MKPRGFAALSWQQTPAAWAEKATAPIDAAQLAQLKQELRAPAPASPKARTPTPATRAAHRRQSPFLPTTPAKQG